MSAPGRALVYGFGVTGQAVARALLGHGSSLVAADDHPSPAARRAADLLGVELLVAPPRDDLRALVGDVDAVLPAPGLPDRHELFEVAHEAGVEVLSELDLAAAWDDRPLVAITGTDGKTTVTTLVTTMLQASGLRAVAAGNTELPLVDAIGSAETQVFVVEASSFRLGHSRHFSPSVATWLNFSPDHLDVHASLEAYEAAKARIWSDLEPGAIAVANADDPVVMAHVPAPDRGVAVHTFGLEAHAGWHLGDGALRTPEGERIADIDELSRSLPHDLANALAAGATATAAGAYLEGVRAALVAFEGLPHRVELVADHDGVRWYDDSKATVPHATLAAVAGFESVVLIAGGRNKGLDLEPLREAAPRLRAVVAIGEAAAEVAAAFAGSVAVQVVDTDIDDAVTVAADLARPGDTVLLSPGCASFDWFGSYHERGEAFQRAVQRLGRGHAEVAR